MITVRNIKYLKQLEQFSSVQHKIIQAENRKAKNVTMFCDAWSPGKKPRTVQIKLCLNEWRVTCRNTPGVFLMKWGFFFKFLMRESDFEFSLGFVQLDTPATT